jgi:hypothetical protein
MTIQKTLTPKKLKYSPFVYSENHAKNFILYKQMKFVALKHTARCLFVKYIFLSLPVRHGKVKQIEIYKFANKAVQHSITIHIWYGALWHAICVKIMNLSIKLKNLYFAFIL